MIRLTYIIQYVLMLALLKKTCRFLSTCAREEKPKRECAHFVVIPFSVVVGWL